MFANQVAPAWVSTLRRDLPGNPVMRAEECHLQVFAAGPVPTARTVPVGTPGVGKGEDDVRGWFGW